MGLRSRGRVELRYNQLNGEDELILTKRQITKIKKSIENGTGTDIKISQTQIRNSVKRGGKSIH